MNDSSLHHDHDNHLPDFSSTSSVSVPKDPIFLARFELKMKNERSDMKYIDSLVSFELKRTKLKLKCCVYAYELNTLIEDMSKKDACEILYHNKTGEVTDALRGVVYFDDFTVSGDYASGEILFVEFTYNINLQSVEQQTTAMINS